MTLFNRFFPDDDDDDDDDDDRAQKLTQTGWVHFGLWAAVGMEIIALVISRSPSTTGHSLHPVNGRSVSREREGNLSLSGKAKNPLSVIGGIRPAHLLCCKIWDKSGTPNHPGIPFGRFGWERLVG